MSPPPMHTSCQTALHSNVTSACQDPMTVSSVETCDASCKQHDPLSPATFMWQLAMCDFAALSSIQTPLAVQKKSRVLKWQSPIDAFPSELPHWVPARDLPITEPLSANTLAACLTNCDGAKRWRRDSHRILVASTDVHQRHREYHLPTRAITLGSHP